MLQCVETIGCLCGVGGWRAGGRARLIRLRGSVFSVIVVGIRIMQEMPAPSTLLRPTQGKYLHTLQHHCSKQCEILWSRMAVSRILHHIHRCLIYEAIMRHFRDKYDAIMKQISISYTKNEVLGAAIFVHCQTTLKL